MVRSLTIFIGVAFLALAGSLAHAGTDPAASCTSSKAKAAGMKASGLLKAFGKNIKKPAPAKLGQSVSKAQSKFTKAFSKAEAKGGCPTLGDTGAIEAKVDAFVSDAVSEVDPPGTTTTTAPPTTTTAPPTTTTAAPTTTTSTTTTTTTSTTTTTTTAPPTTTTTSTTSTTTTTLPALDHYRMYNASALNFTTVAIEDQWNFLPLQDIGDALAFLVPVEKDDPIIDPFTHLTAYLELGPPPVVPLSVDIDNQFGPQNLTIFDPVVLLVPTEKFPPGPGPLPPLPRDHFQCYVATGPTLSVPKVLTDQFSGPDPVTVLAPFLFCNPASKDGGPVLGPPPEHLTCYVFSPSGAPVGPIPIKNQFTEPAIAMIDVFDPFALCVPSEKLSFGPTTTTTTSTTSTTTTSLPIPPLDHFRGYNAFAPNFTMVTITDQWIPPVAVDIGDAAAFFVPVEKDTPIIDPFTHLTGYLELTPLPFVPLSVDIDNQFGPQTLIVVAPVALLVPTEKFPPGPGPLPPLPRDHFQCYSASGPTVGVPKTLTDQFSGPDLVTVLGPTLFCNPASKDGSPILGPAPEHLTCYAYTPFQPPVGPIPFKNQFTEPAVASIDVFDGVVLCVPSLKLSFGPTTTTTTTPTTTTTSTTIVTGKPPCGDATAPLCDGHCPPGMMCIDLGFCGCAPTGGPCGTIGPPLCLGDCPPLMACVDMGGICMCMP